MEKAGTDLVHEPLEGIVFLRGVRERQLMFLVIRLDKVLIDGT